MELKLAGPLDRQAACRYLGCPPQAVDPQLQGLLAGAEEAVLAAARPRGAFRRLPLEWQGGRPLLCGRGALVAGQDIRRHLQGCHAVLLLAVTLGAQLEALIRRAQATDLAGSVVLDAMGSVAAEQAADLLQAQAVARLCAAGEYHTGRYSPGYGDYPLQLQKELLGLLDAQRSIGLAANENAVLTPRKSVTAVVGVAGRPVTGHLAGCESCALRETCSLRKRGGTCGKPEED